MNIGIHTIKLLKNRMFPKLGRFARIAFKQKYLLFTNVSISASLSGLGDVLEQNYEIMNKDLDKWDHIRTLHMSATGITVGVLCHHWYKFLDKRLPGSGMKIVLKKVVLDQFICSPLTIVTFFATLAIVQGDSYKEFCYQLKQKAWRLYAAEWIVWPPAQVVNFYFLPTRFRVLYDSTISLGYDVYTSYVTHKIPIEYEHDDKDLHR